MKTMLFLIFLVVNIYPGSFDRAITFVLAHEGTYCHDGGYESNFGICSLWYPKVNMKTLTREQAIAIYKKDYWDRLGLDMQTDSNFALLIFDTAVLFGQPTARKLFKKCLFSPDAFMDLRIRETDIILSQYPEKKKYFVSWVKRMVDLQKAMCSP